MIVGGVHNIDGCGIDRWFDLLPQAIWHDAPQTKASGDGD